MKRKQMFEIVSAILISLATVGSAWSAYQATRWSGLQSIRFSEANAARVDSAAASGTADQLMAIDVGMFLRWVEAVNEKDERMERFLYKRFRPEFKPAFDAWIATRPQVNPDAPPHPFVMKEYAPAERERATSLVKKAQAKFEAAKDANQTSDNYVLLTVLFAIVLFFSGIAPKFESPKVRTVQLSMGAALLITATSILLTFPVH